MKNIICILLLLLSINSYGKVINDKEIKSPDRLVNFSSGDLLLNVKNCVSICLDPNDLKGVDIAVGNLCTDIHKVCGATVSTSADASSRIIVGTIGHSRAIDLLIKQGKIDGS
ncbi:MAG: glycosyhydrolase, partial [Prevotella sp.]|nr:glycosyhydrolase [Prevotella sp.]